MSNEIKVLRINIETLVLVAVWKNPSIFQGCIKITEQEKNNTILFFFRCESRHREQNDILNLDFSTNDYEFTHLYNESGFIPLNFLDSTKTYALDIMKYALHITLKEMISSRKLQFTSIDDIAMQAMINKIKPILNRELTYQEDDHIGFAVSMDFVPQEKLEHSAALALLKKLEVFNQYH